MSTAATPTPYGDLRGLVAGFLGDLPTSYLACRNDQHSFPFDDDTVQRERVREDGVDCLRVSRRCQRCGTVRKETFNRQSYERVRATYYDKPDGYASPHGPIPRSAIRAEWFRRLDSQYGKLRAPRRK